MQVNLVEPKYNLNFKPKFEIFLLNCKADKISVMFYMDFHPPVFHLILYILGKQLSKPSLKYLKTEFIVVKFHLILNLLCNVTMKLNQ